MLRSRKFMLLAVSITALAIAAPARAAEIDKLTPADASIIMVFNVKQAIDSPLAKKTGLVDKVKAGIESKPEAKQALTALGLDITRDISSVTMSVGGTFSELQALGGSKPEKILVTIHGNFSPDKLDAAAKTVDTIKTSKEGANTIYEIKDKDETTYATLLGKDTIVVSPS